MVTLVVKRFGFMIFTMVVVSLILFLLLETDLTGDPAARVLGQFSNEEQRELWREQHGYNRPIIVRINVSYTHANFMHSKVQCCRKKLDVFVRCFQHAVQPILKYSIVLPV